MKAAWTLLFVLLAAPDDAAQRLRVAWASQYEWREDGIENATLGFRYAYRWQSTEDEDRKSEYEGRGQVVLVGREIVRTHYPAADPSRGRQFERHLEWVFARFVRKPFEERFKDLKFEGPEKAAGGLERITVTGEKKMRFAYLLKGDRIAALEWVPGAPGANHYTTGDLGGGYAILGEETSADLGDRGKTSTKRELKTARTDRAPYPASYRCVTEMPGNVMTVELTFDPPTFNAEHPVAGDPAARDLLKAAWAQRYGVPRDLRIETDFQRWIDNDLDRAYWYGTVKGKLQIWGLDDIQFMVDEGVVRNRGRAGMLDQRLRQHFEWLVWIVGERAFGREFEGCGFAFAADDDPDDETHLVELLGHPKVLAYRVEEGRITGYLENAAEEGRWWNFRLRKACDDRARIDQVTVESGGERLKLSIRYRRKAGVDVPVEFEAVGRGYGGREERCGVAKFRFKRLKVSRPD